MSLFERIKEISKQRGFALTEVARRAEIGEKSIYAWKPSKKYPDGITPKRATLEKVANVLNVSVDYLLGNTDEPQPRTSPATGSDDTPVDLSETNIFTYKGLPISKEDWELIKPMLAAAAKRNQEKDGD